MTDMVANQDNVVKAFNKTNLFIYNLVADDGDTPVPTSDTTTNWQVPVVLPDNARYYWRVRSADTEGSSLWAYNNFFVNTLNDPPSPFLPNSPENESGVDSLTPQLSVMNSRDIDNDVLTYTFEVYEDQAMAVLATDSGIISQDTGAGTSWTVNIELTDNTQYYWRAIAFDGNGAQTATMLQSFLVNTSNHVPTVPVIISPDGLTEIETYDVLLTVENATDEDADPLTYIFEIDKSNTFDSPDRQTSEAILEETETTSFEVSDLEENQKYYWRVKASDGSAAGKWANAGFFVNSINDAPMVPTLKNPGQNAWVDTTNPVLSLHSGKDPDNDQLEYRFEIYSNQELTHFVTQTDSADPDWTVSIDLKNNTRYFWRAQTVDEHGVTSAWTDVSDFFIKLDLVNVAPEIEITMPFEDLVTNAQTIEIQWTDSDPDSSARVSLYYDTDNQGEDDILIIDDIEEDQDSDQDSYIWDISDIDDGVYYIYALISDEESSIYRYAPITITIDRTPPAVTLNVITDSGALVTNTKVYIFKESGSYYGKSATTDAQGNALFDPDDFDSTMFKFRIDYLGNQFWSDPIQLPEVMFTSVVIPVETVDLTVTTTNSPAAGYRVYLFSQSGSYLRQYQNSDDQGQVSFTLPVGISYKFRADILGSQYWTDATVVQSGDSNEVDLETGGGLFTITLQKDEQTPIPGVRMYLFSPTDSYLGRYKTSDENGQVTFEVSQADYKVRADYMGYKFWTDITNISIDTAIDLTLVHKDIIISVSGVYQETSEPITDIRAYLFSPSDSYLGKYEITDENGQVSFSLPDKAYKIRADYLGQQFWSQEFTGQDSNQDTTIDIAMAKAQITVSGAGLPQPDLRVYLFSDTGSYLGQYQTTDTSGQVVFLLPEGMYKFRADYEGSQFWSSVSALAADIVNPVDISVGGGQFTFLAQTDSNESINGMRCYVFTENYSYIGLYGATDNSGEAFFDLANGTYLFRFNYMGEQFWSDPVIVPDQLSYQMTLAHESAEVRVFTKNDTVKNAKVYLFSETDSYLGQYQITSNSGAASFYLPVGVNYKFRADILGSQQWSDVIQITDTGTNQIDLDSGGGLLTVTLQKNDLTPIPDIRMYLFTESGSYTGLYATTDDQGKVAFEVPNASYKVRADYMGYKFWTEPGVISDDTAIDLTIPHGTVQVHVTQSSADIPGARIYLFNENNSYLGQTTQTDTNGITNFQVPADQPYKIRVDMNGQHYWSNAVTVSPEQITQIEMDIN